ncbi:Gag protein [Phytophthora palmivora]|uniref:Gag protein n=1 Tax=Phytophthora palmivora TaxID=4796 RepID=A0A2P4YH22_9STRA|nr:Gag protein [Phytophthora palmivora]
MDRVQFPHLTDSQFESVRKMVLAAATPAEQVERFEAFDTYERGLIAHVQGLQTPVAQALLRTDLKRAHSVAPHATDAALISTERLRIAFALSNLGGRAKTWAYTREATTLGCFTSWAQLCQQFRAAFPPTMSIASARTSFPVNKGSMSCMGTSTRCEYSLHLWWGTPYLNTSREHLLLLPTAPTYLVGVSNKILLPSKRSTATDRLVLLRRCGKATMRRQAQCKELHQLELAPGRYPWNWVRSYRAPSVATDVGSSGSCNVPALREGTGKFPSKPRGSRGPWQKPRPKSSLDTPSYSQELTAGAVSTASHGGRQEPAEEVSRRERAAVDCSWYTRVVLIDAGASTNFARNGDKYADALRESKGRDQDWLMVRWLTYLGS